LLASVACFCSLAPRSQLSLSLSLSLSLPPPPSGSQVATGEKVLYKYVVKSSSAHFSWEVKRRVKNQYEKVRKCLLTFTQLQDRIPDRELKVVGPSSIVNDGTFNQLSRAATFSALQVID
jgi:hypothetical protein